MCIVYIYVKLFQSIKKDNILLVGLDGYNEEGGLRQGEDDLRGLHQGHHGVHLLQVLLQVNQTKCRTLIIKFYHKV